MGNRQSKQSNMSTIKVDDYNNHIIWCLLRINLGQRSLSFPYSIVQLINSMLPDSFDGHYISDTNFKTTDYGFDRTCHGILLDVTKNTFIMQFKATKRNYSFETKLEGTLNYNYRDSLIIFQFNNVSKFVDVFNFLLDHKARRKVYMTRTEEQLKRHHIQLPMNTKYRQYTTLKIYNECIRAEDQKQYYNAYKSKWISRHSTRHVLIDFHDIYKQICNELREDPLPIYIGSQFKMIITSKYEAQLYFNNKLIYTLYRTVDPNVNKTLTNPNVLTLFHLCQYYDDLNCTNFNKFISCAIKLGANSNHFELHYERTYCISSLYSDKKYCKYAGKGVILKDLLVFSEHDGSRKNFRKLLLEEFAINIQHTQKQIKIHRANYGGKIALIFNEKVLWNLYVMRINNAIEGFDCDCAFPQQSYFKATNKV
eukprot:411577_1